MEVLYGERGWRPLCILPTQPWAPVDDKGFWPLGMQDITPFLKFLWQGPSALGFHHLLHACNITNVPSQGRPGWARSGDFWLTVSKHMRFYPRYVTWFLSDPIAELKLPDISPQQLSTQALSLEDRALGMAADARLLHPVLNHPPLHVFASMWLVWKRLKGLVVRRAWESILMPNWGSSDPPCPEFENPEWRSPVCIALLFSSAYAIYPGFVGPHGPQLPQRG